MEKEEEVASYFLYKTFQLRCICNYIVQKIVIPHSVKLQPNINQINVRLIMRNLQSINVPLRNLTELMKRVQLNIVN